MSEQTITFCDYCNSNNSIADSFKKGFVQCSEINSIEFYGWINAEKGIMCIDCQDNLDGHPDKY